MVIATAAGGKARSLWLRPVERAVICPGCSRGFRTVKKEPQSSRKPAALKSVPGDSVWREYQTVASETATISKDFGRGQKL
jgi:hypothetical protein